VFPAVNFTKWKDNKILFLRVKISWDKWLDSVSRRPMHSNGTTPKKFCPLYATKIGHGMTITERIKFSYCSFIQSNTCILGLCLSDIFQVSLSRRDNDRFFVGFPAFRPEAPWHRSLQLPDPARRHNARTKARSAASRWRSLFCLMLQSWMMKMSQNLSLKQSAYLDPSAMTGNSRNQWNFWNWKTHVERVWGLGQKNPFVALHK